MNKYEFREVVKKFRSSTGTTFEIDAFIKQLDTHYRELHFGLVCNCLREQEFVVDSMTKTILIKEFAKFLGKPKEQPNDQK